MRVNEFWMYGFFSLLLILIGGTMNIVVMDANDCMMPVKTDCLDCYKDDECYFGFKDYEEVNKPYLSDIIRVRGIRGTYLMSIGDIIIFLGLMLLIADAIITIIELRRVRRIYKYK